MDNTSPLNWTKQDWARIKPTFKGYNAEDFDKYFDGHSVMEFGAPAYADPDYPQMDLLKLYGKPKRGKLLNAGHYLEDERKAYGGLSREEAYSDMEPWQKDYIATQWLLNRRHIDEARTAKKKGLETYLKNNPQIGQQQKRLIEIWDTVQQKGEAGNEARGLEKILMDNREYNDLVNDYGRTRYTTLPEKIFKLSDMSFYDTDRFAP